MESEQASYQQIRNEMTALRQQIARSHERCVIFVDNTNLSFSIQRLDPTHRYRMCYTRLVNFLTGGRLLRQTRIYYSDNDLGDNDRRQKRETFYGWLRNQGFWTKACRQVQRSDGTIKEKGLDAAIVKDIERLCQHGACDTVILVSGDEDYRDLVVEVQANYGVNVEVAFFPQFASRELYAAATRFINLSEVQESLRLAEAS